MKRFALRARFARNAAHFEREDRAGALRARALLEVVAGVCFDEGKRRRGKAAPMTKAHSEMNPSPAARLCRAAHSATGEAEHRPITTNGHARRWRACPVSSTEMRSISVGERDAR